METEITDTLIKYLKQDMFSVEEFVDIIKKLNIDYKKCLCKIVKYFIITKEELKIIDVMSNISNIERYDNFMKNNNYTIDYIAKVVDNYNNKMCDKKIVIARVNLITSTLKDVI